MFQQTKSPNKHLARNYTIMTKEIYIDRRENNWARTNGPNYVIINHIPMITNL